VSWSWSDAWLLTAAYVADESPVTLARLFAAGDALNKTLFLDQELEHGLTLLGAAGLARLDGEVIALTDDGRRLCRGAFESTTSARDALKKVEEELRAIDVSGWDLTPVEVPEDAVRAAIKEYHATAWRNV
jgi:hypothetical protein